MESKFFRNFQESLQFLCTSFLEFDSSAEVVGFINVRTDRGLNKNILIDETVEKEPDDTVKFLANSFVERTKGQGCQEEQVPAFMMASTSQTPVVIDDPVVDMSQVEELTSVETVVCLKVADELWNMDKMRPMFLRLSRQFNAPEAPKLPPYHRKKSCNYKKSGVCSCRPDGLIDTPSDNNSIDRFRSSLKRDRSLSPPSYNRDQLDQRPIRDLRDQRPIRDLRDQRPIRDLRVLRDQIDIRDLRNESDIRDLRDQIDLRDRRDQQRNRHDSRDRRYEQVSRDLRDQRDLRDDESSRDQRDKHDLLRTRDESRRECRASLRWADKQMASCTRRVLDEGVERRSPSPQKRGTSSEVRRGASPYKKRYFEVDRSGSSPPSHKKRFLKKVIREEDILDQRRFKTFDPNEMKEWLKKDVERRWRLARNEVSMAALTVSGADASGQGTSSNTDNPEVQSIMGFSGFGGGKVLP